MGHNIFEAPAFLVIVNLARDAARAVVRHQDQVPAGNADIGRDPRTLGADGPLDDLNDDLAARRVKPRDVVLGDFLLVLLLVLARNLDEVDPLVERFRDDVPVMQERVFLKADIHKGGLQAGLKILDFALEDAGDDLFLGRPLDGELLQLAVLHDGHPIFERLGVDDDFLVEFL